MNRYEAHTLLEIIAAEITKKLINSGHNITEQTKLLRKQLKAIDMGIEALTDNVSEDGTLTVHVSNGSKVKRVLVLGDDRCGSLYYADGDDD